MKINLQKLLSGWRITTMSDIEGIEHSKIQVRSPQSNGICERLHRTMQDEFYAVAFRKKLYESAGSFFSAPDKDLLQWFVLPDKKRL
jgi:transposase InsO family protein